MTAPRTTTSAAAGVAASRPDATGAPEATGVSKSMKRVKSVDGFAGQA